MVVAAVNWPLALIGALFLTSSVLLLWGCGRLMQRLDESSWADKSWRRRAEWIRRKQDRPSGYWFVPFGIGLALALGLTFLIFVLHVHVGPGATAIGMAIGFLIVYGLAVKPNSGFAAWQQRMAESSEARRQFNRRFSLVFGVFLLLVGGAMVLGAVTACSTPPC